MNQQRKMRWMATLIINVSGCKIFFPCVVGLLVYRAVVSSKIKHRSYGILRSEQETFPIGKIRSL